MSRIELPMLENPGGLERELGILLLNKSSEKIALPLGSVDICARVINQIAQVTVKQVFRNNCREHLEAVYIFPLAAGSAVYSFNMKVGERVVKGVVQERAEARRQYQQALEDGKRAALMEQERDDVFTVQVGNLPPGEEVTVEICYSERLPFYENGSSELRLPLLVSPRYIPGNELERDAVGDGIAADTDLVPDASRITPPRLAPGADPGTALKLKVDILPEDGVEISDLSCSQHATKTALSQGGLTVSLARADEKLNRDFVLRWQSTSGKVRTSLLTYSSPDHAETYGMLSIMPPRRSGFLGVPRDVVFVLDRSGSMQGIKMNSAVRASAILLNTLGPKDRFAIAAFDDLVEWMPAQGGARFVQADARGIETGEKYLRGIDSRGGTEMDNAIRNAFSALASCSQDGDRLPSIVLLTDGEVGNESQILQRVQNEIGGARLFVVGIDTSVNAGLLKRLASLGGGTAAFVEPGIQLEEALASVGREIGVPLVTDIQVESLDLCLDRASLSPFRVPDIFAGRPSVCFFKLTGKGKLSVKGRLPDAKPFEEKVKAQSVEMPSIAQLWAKTHIVDLEDQYRVNPAVKAHLKKEIIDLAVKHSLLTRFTAFVVVDEAEVVNKTGDLRKVVQPVEMPQAWEMEDNLHAAPGLFKGAMKMCQAPAAQASAGRIMPAADEDQGFFDSLSGAASCEASLAADEWSAPMNDAADSWGAPAAGPSVPRPMNAPSAPPVPQPSCQAPPPPPLPGSSFKKKDACADFEAESPERGTAYGFSGSSGSFGTGVRQQVFEVIVRQAIAGAPWKEICAGPMQVNNISEDEVESEIDRRLALMGKAPLNKSAKDEDLAKAKMENVAWRQGVLKRAEEHRQSESARLEEARKAQAEKEACRKAELERVRAMLLEFIRVFEKAFRFVENGQRPDAVALESLRVELLQTLSRLDIGTELPGVQRFLRSSAVDLIASLKDLSVNIEDIQLFWKSREKLLKDLQLALDNSAFSSPKL